MSRVFVVDVVKAHLFLVSLFGLMIPSSASAHDVAVTGLVQNSKPKYVLDNNHVRGLCGDIYAELAKRLKKKGVKMVVQSHTTPIKRILATLLDNETGIYCGASKSAKRAKIYPYSETPLYYVSNIVLAHKDNPTNPASFKELKESNALVGGFHGAGSTNFLKKSEVVRINDGFKSLDKGMKSLAAGELDYFFYHDLGLFYYLTQHKTDLRAVPTKFRSYPHWMIFSPKMPEKIRTMINIELKLMVEAGVIENLWGAYKP